jgi:hypothetical protein
VNTALPNADELTSPQAAAMIAQNLTRDPQWSQLEIRTAFPGGKDCAIDARRGWPDRDDRRWINRISKTWPDLGNAISSGFFDVIYDPAPECLRAMCIGGSDCNLILRPSAQPYVIATEKDRSGFSKPEDIVWLRVHDGVDVSVTGMTQPAVMQGQYVSTTEFTYKLRLSPLGTALSNKNGTALSKGRAVFVLFDDGWRVAGVDLD